MAAMPAGKPAWIPGRCLFLKYINNLSFFFREGGQLSLLCCPFASAGPAETIETIHRWRQPRPPRRRGESRGFPGSYWKLSLLW